MTFNGQKGKDPKIVKFPNGDGPAGKRDAGRINTFGAGSRTAQPPDSASSSFSRAPDGSGQDTTPIERGPEEQESAYSTQLKEGARNLLASIGLTPENKKKLLIIGDGESQLAELLWVEANKIIGTPKHVKRINLPDFRSEDAPLTGLPPKLVHELTDFNGSMVLFVAACKKGEQGFMEGLIKYLKENGITDGLLPGIRDIDAEFTLTRAPALVQGWAEKLQKLAGSASEIRVTNADTTLTFLFNKNEEWHIASPFVGKGESLYLPSGGVFSSPSNVNGTLVTPMVGQPLVGGLMNLGAREALALQIKDSAIEVDARKSRNSATADNFNSYLLRQRGIDSMSAIVSKLFLGANPDITELTGSMACNLASPFHITFGSTAAFIDKPTIELVMPEGNGIIIVENGQFVSRHFE